MNALEIVVQLIGAGRDVTLDLLRVRDRVQQRARSRSVSRQRLFQPTFPAGFGDH
jgi:hypothetical protein